jgi:hypothetical protein
MDIDKGMQESTETVAAKPKCDKCGKRGKLYQVEGKPYCLSHYNGELKKLRDSIVIRLIDSLEDKLADNPALLSDTDKKLLTQLKATYQSSRFKSSKSSQPSAKDIASQIQNMPKEDLLTLLAQALLKK